MFYIFLNKNNKIPNYLFFVKIVEKISYEKFLF